MLVLCTAVQLLITLPLWFIYQNILSHGGSDTGNMIHGSCHDYDITNACGSLQLTQTKKQQTEIETIIASINNYSWLFSNGKLFTHGFLTLTAGLQLSLITYHALLSIKRIPDFITYDGRYKRHISKKCHFSF